MGKEKINTEEFDSLISRVLQGLAFWVGYKKQLFSSYHFSEGALTAELYTLFNSVKKDHFYIKPEFPFSKMPNSSNFTTGLGRNKSVDILLVEKDSTVKRNKEEEKKSVLENSNLYLFEVKKSDGNIGKIKEDFEKIHQYLLKNKKAKGYLILINQRPLKNFLGKQMNIFDEEGNFDYNNFQDNDYYIKDLETENQIKYTYSFKIKMVRAAKTFKTGRNSIFAILIEIISK